MNVRRCNFEDNIDSLQNCYIIKSVDVHDTVSSVSLLNEGYRFLDRIMEMVVILNEKDSKRQQVSVDKSVAQIRCDDTCLFSDDMYQLAFAAFKTDRRFHLEQYFNQEEANKIILQYMHEIARNSKLKVYRAYHESELLGFTIVDEEQREVNGCCENILGATIPGIKGKMVATSLYSIMMAGEAAVCKKYIGKVSSSNLASLNLHISLGAKVNRIYDEYIIKK